jgi:hypothetical protein
MYHHPKAFPEPQQHHLAVSEHVNKY